MNCGLKMKGKFVTGIKHLVCIGMMFAYWTAGPAVAGDSETTAIPSVPTQGLVTMVDLGAHKCIPCKMMAPIIKELQTEYDGR